MGVGGVMMKILRNERGSSTIIELACIIPVMVMVLYGYTLFTNTISTDLALKTAAREGAREYAMTGSASDGIAKANAELISSDIEGYSIESFTDGEGRGIRTRKTVGINIP